MSPRGATTGSPPSPTTARLSSCAWWRRRSTATCSSTSPAPSTTTWRCARRRCAPGSRSASTGSRTSRAATCWRARTRPTSTPGSGWRGSRRSCARTAARSRPPARAGCPSSSRSTRSGATCTRTPTGRTARRRSKMVEAARARGYGYMNVTDHSPSVGFGMGLDAGRLRDQIERVRALAETLAPDFTLLAGAEVDILRDGSLDYSDELLAELDVVVASVHASHRLSSADQTKRICAALENPHVDILGHPTGRRIGTREPNPLDIEAVIAKAVETRTIIEVSSQPERLDLRDTHVRLAVEAGARLVVNTDAHSVAALDYLRFGVATARRGWATAADIVNTREWPELKAELGP